MKNVQISVCIPTFEMGGMGGEYLDFNLEQLAQQDFSDFEVIVSDQSTDQVVFDVCQKYTDVLDIVYCDNKQGKRQSSANSNNALRHASGKIIKIIFQDDYLLGKQALSLIAEAFETDKCGWLLTGCEHTRDGKALIRPFYPRYHSAIQFGKNTISSPSVLAIKNDHCLLFDEKLIWLMDVDYYKRCYDLYGAPKILNELLVVNRQHHGQVSSSVSAELIAREVAYVYEKYSDKMSILDHFYYFRKILLKKYLPF